MSWKEIIKKCLNVASAPIRRNANFFVFMYLLGMISSIVTTPAKGTLYDNLFLELFVDLYVVCAVVAIFPKKVRLGLRAVLYLILYSTAAADTYCYVNFGSTLNPSMLMWWARPTVRRLAVSSQPSSLPRFSSVVWAGFCFWLSSRFSSPSSASNSSSYTFSSLPFWSWLQSRND